MKIIECTVQEVFGHFDNNGNDIQIRYVLKPHEGPEDSIDTRSEDKVFKST